MGSPSLGVSLSQDSRAHKNYSHAGTGYLSRNADTTDTTPSAENPSPRYQ